jgi:chemotaxis protein methyltransferase CheR
MILAEQKLSLGNRSFEILGTDIAREQLARASDGLYSQFEVQRGLPMQYLVKYFKKDGTNWRINDTLRGMVQFKLFNLLSDLRSLGQFDIVFCRNVLIYFDQPTKARVLAAIAKQMPADGVLYLGGAETVLGITDAFASSPGERGVYERTSADAKRPLVAAGR